jgi:coenzyme PQQ precursor peptide PqqA
MQSLPMGRRRLPRHSSLRAAARTHHPFHRRPLMQWQTPSATNFRFGFEITMYVAAR